MKGWQKYGLIATVTVLVVGFGVWFLTQGPKLDAATSAAHTLEHHDGVAATCTSAGLREYWQCTDCGQYFRDELGLSEIDSTTFSTWVTVDKLDHKSSSKYYSAGREATCFAAGQRAGYLCISGCGQYFADEGCKNVLSNVIIPQKTHQGVKVTAKDATCEGDGYITHYECSNCHYTFADPACAIPKGDIALPGGHHVDQYVPRLEATCLAPGHVEYYTCTTCDKMFNDDACQVELTNVELEQLDHVSDSDFHTKETPATCTKDGTMEYWLCKNGCGQKFTTDACKEIFDVNPLIPALGHVYDTDFTRQSANLVSAASRYYDQSGNLVSVNAVYQETCYRCGEPYATKEFSGFASLATTKVNGTNVSQKLEYDRETRFITADVFTVDADAFKEKDNQWELTLRVATAQTYHSGSTCQMTDHNGNTTTVDISTVKNYNVPLTITLDAVPTTDTVWVWTFDWDGDGKYEQTIKVIVKAKGEVAIAA
ncbi:MAG: hypothetical protein NC133_03200 [Prevotella sp.]|nr:hypothetical protein [Prevotella sp.]